MKGSKLKPFLKWFWFGEDIQQISEGKKIVAKYLRDYFEKCPACEKSFDGHFITRFACTVMSSENEIEVERFLKEFRQNNWDLIKNFEQFDPQEDVLIAQTIKCPFGLAIKLISLEPYSLDEPYQVVEYEVLSNVESEKLLKILPMDGWNSLK